MTTIRRSTFPTPLLCIVPAALLAVSGVQASEVSFSGGFTSFRGPVATATGSSAASVHTEINGVTTYADEALPGAEFGFINYGIGLKNTFSLLDSGGSPIQQVEFSSSLFSGPNPNAISFAPSTPLDLQVGDVFRVGTFTVTNGGWFGNSALENIYPDTDFGFSVTTHSTDPALDGFTFSDTLRFVVTNPSDPAASVQDAADYFYFVGKPALQTLSVLEKYYQGNPTSGNTGTVDLMVKIGSLIPVALTNPTGAAFVGNQVSSIPEPGSGALLLAGIGVLFAVAKRHRPR